MNVIELYEYHKRQTMLASKHLAIEKAGGNILSIQSAERTFEYFDALRLRYMTLCPEGTVNYERT